MTDLERDNELVKLRHAVESIDAHLFGIFMVVLFILSAVVVILFILNHRL